MIESVKNFDWIAAAHVALFYFQSLGSVSDTTNITFVLWLIDYENFMMKGHTIFKISWKKCVGFKKKLYVKSIETMTDLLICSINWEEVLLIHGNLRYTGHFSGPNLVGYIFFFPFLGFFSFIFSLFYKLSFNDCLLWSFSDKTCLKKMSFLEFTLYPLLKAFLKSGYRWALLA